MSIIPHDTLGNVLGELGAAVGTPRRDGVSEIVGSATLSVMRRTGVGRRLLFDRSMREVRRRMETEGDVGDVLDTVLDIQPGYRPYRISVMQLRDELASLVSLLREERPTTVVEIGTARGGSLYVWSRCLDSAETIVSVDLPAGRFGGGYERRKAEIFRTFAPSKRMRFVRGDSHDESTYETVQETLDGEIDFLFVDGDRTYEGVKRDFEMYGDLVADDGIVAFHDIVPHPDHESVVEERRETVADLEDRHLVWGHDHPDCNVDRLWDELVDRYETTEFVSHPQQTWGGIGVVHL